MSNEKTVIIGSNNKPFHLGKESLKNVAARVGFGAAGIAGGVGISSLFMGMAPNAPDAHAEMPVGKPDVIAEPKEITSVTDEMSFGDAFSAAREEAGGPNGYFVWHGKVFETIYKEEMDKLSPEEKHTMYVRVMEKYNETESGEAENNTVSNQQITSPVIVLHDEAPVASHVSDDMSFKDAFAVAREEVGPGGVFEWNGKTYNTYTSEESNAMTSEQKQEFMASAGNTEPEGHNISANEVDIVKIDGGDSTIPTAIKESESVVNSSSESETADGQMLEEQWIDDGTGNKIHVAHFLVNGEHIVKVDQDGDGKFDLTMTPNEDGSVHLVTADGQEANLSQEDMMQFQAQLGEGEIPFTEDNVSVETDPNSYLTNTEDY
jgi:hypothetical protein